MCGGACGLEGGRERKLAGAGRGDLRQLVEGERRRRRGRSTVVASSFLCFCPRLFCPRAPAPPPADAVPERGHFGSPSAHSRTRWTALRPCGRASAPLPAPRPRCARSFRSLSLVPHSLRAPTMPASRQLTAHLFPSSTDHPARSARSLSLSPASPLRFVCSSALLLAWAAFVAPASSQAQRSLLPPTFAQLQARPCRRPGRGERRSSILPPQLALDLLSRVASFLLRLPHCPVRTLSTFRLAGEQNVLASRLRSSLSRRTSTGAPCRRSFLQGLHSVAACLSSLTLERYVRAWAGGCRANEGAPSLDPHRPPYLGPPAFPAPFRFCRCLWKEQVGSALTVARRALKTEAVSTRKAVDERSVRSASAARRAPFLSRKGGAEIAHKLSSLPA